MRNNSTTTQRATLARTHHNGRAAAGAARDGYHDACKGLGFRPEYDSMTRANQNNYETGRLWAASFKAAGLKPPAWPSNVILPKALEAQVQGVCTLNGAPSIPRTRRAGA